VGLAEALGGRSEGDEWRRALILVLDGCVCDGFEFVNDSAIRAEKSVRVSCIP
jgi:hypothetical protein